MISIPNNDSKAFFSMDVKFRSSDQDSYELKLNSLAVILFSIRLRYYYNNIMQYNNVYSILPFNFLQTL